MTVYVFKEIIGKIPIEIVQCKGNESLTMFFLTVLKLNGITTKIVAKLLK